MTVNTNDKTGRTTEVAAFIAGAAKQFDPKQPIMLRGVATTVGKAMAKMQTFVDNRAAVVAAQAKAKTELATERAQLPELLHFADLFEAFVHATFGPQPDVLSDFGLEPPKERRPLTSAQHAIAVAKRNATREARRTMGPRQMESAQSWVLQRAPTSTPR